MGAFDAFGIRKRLKACLPAFCWVVYAYYYVSFRWTHSWTSVELCTWTSCTSPKTIALQNHSLMLTFLGKLAFAYISGKDFATWRPRFRWLSSLSFSDGS